MKRLSRDIPNFGIEVGHKVNQQRQEEGEMSQVRKLTVVLIGFMLMAGTALAQVDRGTITGTVTDQSGAVVTDVAITVTNVATGVSNDARTSDAGVYVVPLLQAGKVSADGGEARVQEI